MKKSTIARLTLIGAALLWFGSYMFPFGYAESFYWFQQNWFNGSYADTTWFFYAWTSAALLGGGIILMRVTGLKPKQLVKRALT